MAESGEVRPKRNNGWGTTRLVRPWRERFEEKVERSGGSSGCHPWTASRKRFGYGQFAVAPGVIKTAHRIAWEIANGCSVPDGLVVRHLCGNPPCCNPLHLTIGTAWDNAQDTIAHGRTCRGTRSGTAKLTDADVAQIREFAGSGWTAMQIAERFTIKRTAVYDIVRGVTWAHLPDANPEFGQAFRMSDEDRAIIRARLERGDPVLAIAQAVGVDKTTVYLVARTHGLKTASGRIGLTLDDAAEIRRRSIAGERRVSIAQAFGISISYVSLIARGERLAPSSEAA